jgi:flavoprotein hydroxylase
VLPPIPPAVLGPGVLASGADGASVGLAGQLSPQGRVARVGGAEGRFDEVVGTGFVVAASVDLSPVLSGRLRVALDRLGAHVVRFAAPGTVPEAGGGGEVVIDVDGFYLAWLDTAGCAAIVIRPDFYIFGAVPAAGELPALLDEIFAKLELTH